jgi:DNA repair protein RadC
MKIKDWARVDRPREKLSKYGAGKLSTAELLAILLRTGTKKHNAVEVAGKILRKFPTHALAEAQLSALRAIDGVGETKALSIVAAVELGRRVLQDKPSALLLSPQDVWQELKDIREHKKEHFIVFYLDTRSREIRREVISIGTLNANLVHPREVFEPAIRCNAAQLIIAHNHPSGDPQPSPEDIALTKRLAEAGHILGIEILDHVIVARAGHTSLKAIHIL